MTNKERLKSWQAREGLRPSWETWKRILRLPWVNNCPKRAIQQWDAFSARVKTRESHEA